MIVVSSVVPANQLKQGDTFLWIRDNNEVNVLTQPVGAAGYRSAVRLRDGFIQDLNPDESVIPYFYKAIPITSP